MYLPETDCRRRPVLYVRTHNDTDAVGRAISLQGWDVNEVNGFRDASQIIIERQYNVGLIHLEQSDNEQVRAAESLLTEHRSIEWVLLTNSICLQQRSFCKLISESCYDYFTLPLSGNGFKRLFSTLGHAYGMAALLPQDAPPNYDDYEMVGTSQPMLKLFESIRKVAGVEAPVLIVGESGTGKELIARAIHERSSCAGNPFVAVNCGAIPENLIQSELFGHEKGAFTGAHKQNIGQIEAASGGTLFLDEIGDLPLPMQVNLLRFLQEKVIQRVGSSEEIPVDVRILAATNIDLEAAVKEGRFREDLLYRLNVLQLQPPSLRSRQGDIELLAQFFFQHFITEGRAKLRGFSQKSLLAMEHYNWPGNVRELINRVRRAIVMCDGRLIKPEDLGLPDLSTEDIQPVISLEEARIRAEKEAIIRAVRYCHHNMSQAAKTLDVSRVTLYRMIEKYQLQKLLDNDVTR